jgi:toxin ParE1/3/4
MNRISLSEMAQADLDSVWTYIGIEQHSPGAARRQLERILDVLNFLAENPLMGEARPDLRSNLRCLSTGNYVIFYVAASDGIEVERVVHGSRDVGQLF